MRVLPRSGECWKVFGITMFFVTGSLVTVLNGIILKNTYSWKYGLSIQFSKPWFTNFMLFSGMALFSIPFLVKFIYNKRKKIPTETFDWYKFRATSIPSILYLTATALQNYALLYMPITVWQVFFSFQVLFTTLFAVTYRKQQLFLVDWLGLFVTVSGIAFTGVAGLLRGVSSAEQSISKMFYMFIVAIFSHGIKALETILEEKLMHQMHGITGTQLTAFEGLWGFFILLFICLPICQSVSRSSALYENTIESFQQLARSKMLSFLNVLYLILFTIFSYFGFQVTEMSSAIHRNMYETVRPLTVWMVSTALRYITGNKLVGEQIDNYSIIELTGFFISVIGSLIYNRVLRFPCLIYIEDELNQKNISNLDSQPLLLNKNQDY